jgi:GNAT superfamily N-acetyltransferase
MNLRVLAPDQDTDLLSQLSQLAAAAAEDGAAVHFADNVAEDDLKSFRDHLQDRMRLCRVVVIGALKERSLLGSAMLCLDRSPSQSHVTRLHALMVRRDMQKRGIGSALMAFAEVEARNRDRWLMLSEAVSGSPAAHMLVRAQWEKVGDVPALVAMPWGGLAPGSIYFKRLQSG